MFDVSVGVGPKGLIKIGWRQAIQIAVVAILPLVAFLIGGLIGNWSHWL